MKVFFIGRYNSSENLTGPEKVAKRIFNEFTKENKSVFIEYFFDGREYGYFKKLFGRELLSVEGNAIILRLGIITLLFYLFKEKPSVVHIITYERFAMISFLYKLFSKVKIVYNVHGIVYHENSNYKVVSRGYILRDKICENILLKYSDKIIFLSDLSVDIASNYFKFNKKKISILPNGIDKIFYKNNKKKNNNEKMRLKFVFVGDISRKEKGFDFLINVIDEVKFPFELYVLGNEQKSFKENIFYIPKSDTGSYAELISDKDIFISTSEYEPFSVSAVEAMASGLVPLVTKESGMSFYIENNKNGFVINYANKQELLQYMNLLNSERDALDRISNNAKEIYNLLSWEKVFLKYKKLYE